MWYTSSVRIALLVGDLYAPGVSLRQRRTVKAPYGDKHQKRSSDLFMVYIRGLVSSNIGHCSYTFRTRKQSIFSEF